MEEFSDIFAFGGIFLWFSTYLDCRRPLEEYIFRRKFSFNILCISDTSLFRSFFFS